MHITTNPEMKIPEKRAVLHESSVAAVWARISLTLRVFGFFPFGPTDCVLQNHDILQCWSVSVTILIKKTPNHINCNKQRYFAFCPLGLLSHVKFISGCRLVDTREFIRGNSHMTSFWGRECSDLSAENTKIYLASHNHELLELSQTCSTPLWDPQHHFTYRVNYVLSTSLPDYKIPSMRTEPIQHLYSNHQAECLTSIW